MTTPTTASLSPALSVPSLGLAQAGQASSAASVSSSPQNTVIADPALTALAVPATGNSSMSSLVSLIQQVISTLSTVLGNDASTSSFTGATSPTGSVASTIPATAGAAAPTTGLAQTASAAPRKPVIAQIDSFQTDRKGFNHGQTVAGLLSKDNGAGSADLVQYDLSNGISISGALNDVIAKVQSGETIDAVELPQQSFSNNAESADVRAAIQQLSALGVPVVVAAGNNGPNQKNALADNSGLVVENIENGKLDANSGTGNVSFQGTTTSFASANLAAVVAAQRASGLSLAQIRQQLGVA